MKALGILAVAALVFGAPAISVADEQSLPRVLNAQGGYNPPKPKEGFRYPDCFCTDSQGERIELGRSTCLQIGSRQFTARCSMSLNTPAWRQVSEGCPSV
ncbi:MAG: hypothetical protein AB8B85_13625 [Paracoccaceae bacterium]